MGIYAAESSGEIALRKFNTVPILAHRHRELARLIPFETDVDVDALAIGKTASTIIHAAGILSLPCSVKATAFRQSFYSLVE